MALEQLVDKNKVRLGKDMDQLEAERMLAWVQGRLNCNLSYEIRIDVSSEKIPGTEARPEQTRFEINARMFTETELVSFTLYRSEGRKDRNLDMTWFNPERSRPGYDNLRKRIESQLKTYLELHEGIRSTAW